MLRELLQRVEAAEGPVSLAELGRELGVEPAALDGMLQYWVCRGRLAVEGRPGAVCASAGAAACHCGSCPGAAECPFIARLPLTYRVRQAE